MILKEKYIVDIAKKCIILAFGVLCKTFFNLSHVGF